MFQKLSLKQAILQLSKAIALIIFLRKLSIHTVQCSVTFQNSINWLINSQRSTLTKSSEQSKFSN